jgi:hypothetical protein
MSPSFEALAALDNSAARFADCPNDITAGAYHAMANLYARLGLIDPEELANILSLVLNWSGA